MKELDILGVKLREYSLREAMRLTDQYMNNGALNAVLYLTNQNLVKIAEDETKKEFLESVDMVVWQGKDILEAAGMLTRSREREIANNEYGTEFLKKAGREKRKIYLLSENTAQGYSLMAQLLNCQGNLNIVGMYTMESNQDDVVNTVNDVAPDIVIASFDFESQLAFLCENKMMINSSLWLGLLEDTLKQETKAGISRLFNQYYNKTFKRKVNKYNQEKADL